MKKRIITSLLLSLSLVLLDVVSFEYVCNSSEGVETRFFGFPYIYRSAITGSTSLTGAFFIKGFLGNLLSFFAVIIFLITIIKGVELKGSLKRKVNYLLYGLLLIFFSWATYKFTIVTWDFEWENTLMDNVTCEKHLTVFSLGD